jgi:hypothetical protein
MALATTLLFATTLATNAQKLLPLFSEPFPTELPAAAFTCGSATEPNVFIIPMIGQVGYARQDFVANSRTEFITSDIFSRCCRPIRDRKPGQERATVILDLSGPGGYFDEAASIIRQIKDLQDANHRVVAWTGGEVLSADAEIAMTCCEIVTRPACTLGAAVLWQIVDGKPVDARGPLDDAVAAKFYSAIVAPLQESQDRCRRPRCVEESMRVQAAELWWSPTSGFSPSRQEGTNWRQLDSASEVLTLSASQLLETKLAIGSADDIPKLLLVLGIPANAGVKRMDSVVRENRESLRKQLKSVQDGIKALLKQVEEHDQAAAAGDGPLIMIKRTAILNRIYGLKDRAKKANLMFEADREAMLATLDQLAKFVKSLPKAR